LFAIFLFVPAAASAQSALPYRDPKLPVEQRVADLLSRMTLEEKVAQMEGAWENRKFFSDPKTLFVNQDGNFLPEHAAVLLKNGLGEISRPSEKRGARHMAIYTNTV
jgi:beta-glucosidase